MLVRPGRRLLSPRRTLFLPEHTTVDMINVRYSAPTVGWIIYVRVPLAFEAAWGAGRGTGHTNRPGRVARLGGVLDVVARLGVLFQQPGEVGLLLLGCLLAELGQRLTDLAAGLASFLGQPVDDGADLAL